MNKYSMESLDYVKDFIRKYHQVIGNKFFPCIFLKLQTDNTDIIGNYTITEKDLSELTFKNIFPIIKVKSNFEKKEAFCILNSILAEVRKEKHDEFPYFMAYQEELKINFCLRYSKLLNYMSAFIFSVVIVKIL
jgi:hypothetical protein